MRIRITKPLTGVIGGKLLSSLVPQAVYEVEPHIAAQLIEMKGAVEVRSTDALYCDEGVDLERLMGGVHVSQQHTAHDRPTRRSIAATGTVTPGRRSTFVRIVKNRTDEPPTNDGR